jgi:hypothetical protein
MREFATDDEAAVYHMLTQVLHNHLATHGMAFEAALTAGGMVLIGVCQQFGTAGASLDVLLPHTCACLKQHLRRRRASAVFPSALMALTPASKAHVIADAEALRDALVQLLCDAGREHGIWVDGGFRIALSLMADLLSVFLHHRAKTPEEIDAFIDGPLRATLVRHLPAPPG